VLWKLIRRGGSSVEVRDHAEGTLICYQGFPYFDDPVYEALTRASIRVMLELTGAKPRVRIEQRSDTSLHILGIHG
jgi:hypothetical protein